MAINQRDSDGGGRCGFMGLGLLVCGLLTATAAGQGASISVATGAVVLKTERVPPPGKGPFQFNLIHYEPKPNGTYSTGIGTAGSTRTYYIGLLLGYTTNPAGTPLGGFVAYNPLQLPTDISSGVGTNYYIHPAADPATIPAPATTLGWGTASFNDHYLYTIQTPPGPGSRAMQATLYRSPNYGSGLVVLAESLTPLP